MNLYLKPSLKADFPHYLVRKCILHLLNENLEKFKGKVLDLGCGIMPYKSMIISLKNVIEYQGMDLKENPAQNVFPDIIWDGKTIPLESNSVDTVLITEVIEHIDDTASLFNEIKRVLNKDGRVVGTTPFFWPLHEIPNDKHRFTPFGLRSVLDQSGFREINISATGGWKISFAQFLSLYIGFGIKSNSAKRLMKGATYFPIKWMSSHLKTITDFENRLMINVLFFSAIKDN